MPPKHSSGERRAAIRRIRVSSQRGAHRRLSQGVGNGLRRRWTRPNGLPQVRRGEHSARLRGLRSRDAVQRQNLSRLPPHRFAQHDLGRRSSSRRHEDYRSQNGFNVSAVRHRERGAEARGARPNAAVPRREANGAQTGRDGEG
jgi:hypothetical protein